MASVRVVCLFAAAFLVAPSLAHSADMLQARLIGLTGVHLVVGDIKPDAEKDGLRKANIQTDADLKLRLAGIRILTQEEWQSIPGHPLLDITVVTLKSRGTSMYVFGVEVALREQVTAIRNGQSLMASTWESDVLGTVGEANLSESVRESVRDELDKFITAFRVVNPKR